MALQNRAQQLVDAWRALAAREGRRGWLTVIVREGYPCRILAGRKFPGNEEAVLFGFRTACIPASNALPEGRGFSVTLVEDDPRESGWKWMALGRRASANTDLFTMMAVDVIGAVEESAHLSEERLAVRLVDRVRAWQEFMQRSGSGVLSPDEELGLFGEVLMLGTLLEKGMPAAAAVQAWQGPVGGGQDFAINTGGIEVKSSASADRFIARVSSLEQLDDSMRNPIFVAAMGLAGDERGQTLPECISHVRSQLEGDSARDMFTVRLLHAGYAERLASHYGRRCVLKTLRMLHVQGAFPRLTRAGVPAGIVKARYEVDLDGAANHAVPLDVALQLLGGGE